MTAELPELPAALLDYLAVGRPALLLTTGDDGYAHSAYTWVLALSAGRLAAAVDHGSRTLDNLQRTGRAAVHLMGEDNRLFLIKGPAAIVKARLEAAPLSLALAEVRVESVRSQAWPAVRVAPLRYEWPPERAAEMQAMEQALFQEMRSAAAASAAAAGK